MDEYLGYQSVQLTNEEAEALADPTKTFGCLQNEYLAAFDMSGKLISIHKCKDGRMRQIPFKTIKTRFLGTVKARNVQQIMAIDLLYDPETTVKLITGRFGAGKDFLMCSAAVDLIERGKFDKIVYVRNNIEVKDTKPIGFLPGTYNEKMMPFAMPMADHLGGVSGLGMMMDRGQIEIIHLGLMRGRDIKNSIILCSEAENMTKEHMQLLIGRVGEGSSLWINGDLKQRDARVFYENNGIMAMVEKLKGHPRFGYVKLLKSERSETAAMADLLD